MGNEVKNIFSDISNKHDFVIKYIEVDKDHIHMMIAYPPRMSVVYIVKILKQISTYTLWRDDRYRKTLEKNFWKEKTFWSDGYFVCSVGEVSEKMLKKYIESQG